MSKVDKCQVLVIGSGAGGASTALSLAEKRIDVAVLEEGNRYGLDSYGKSPSEAMRALYRRRGMTPIMGSAPIGFVEGCCVGGSTEINSGFWHRTPREILLRWKAQYELDGATSREMDPHFGWAEELLDVQTSESEWRPSTRAFAEGIEAMGWAMQEVPRTVSDCRGLNLCPSGCPSGAKKSMSIALLPKAEALGVKIIPKCRAELILTKSNRVTGVLASLRLMGGEERLVRIDCENLVLCAGPIQTPALLRRSGIKRHVGDTLRIHPMLKVAARFKHDMNAEETVLPLVQVKEFWPEITLGGAYYSLGHMAMILRENWIENHPVIRDHRKTAIYYVAVQGSGVGSIRPSAFEHGPTEIRYELSRYDVKNLSKGLARLATVLLAGGAEEVYPSVTGLPSIRTEVEAVRWLDEELPKSSLALTTVHAFSSCPMGERQATCAADSYGKILGYENLYINDAAMLPSSPGVNPQGTIMAFARRNSLHFSEVSQ